MTNNSANPIDLAIIGGTGVYALAELAQVQTHSPNTGYGPPSGPIRTGTLAGARVAFLARHGEAHSVPPHRINYRANLAALKSIGVERVLALNTVGGIAQRYAPRVLGCPDQLIDYTWGRVSTLSEEAGDEVLHVDFGDPYTPSLRAQVLAAARRAGIAVVDGGCYGVTQGPRLETKAEIARLRRDGCDLVGMTGMPEAVLARELGLEYACLAIVANWAAGAGPALHEPAPNGPAPNGPAPNGIISFGDVLANVAAASADVSTLLSALLSG